MGGAFEELSPSFRMYIKADTHTHTHRDRLIVFYKLKDMGARVCLDWSLEIFSALAQTCR